MQQPTCTNTRIATTDDAHRVFHAAGILGTLGPMVHRRLDADERRFVRPGSVFVWEERSTTSEAAGLGIERWTDGLRWGPSRVRDFLFYQEKYTKAEGSNILTKQTYSAWVDLPAGPKKWHLTAYFTQATVGNMKTVDDIPGMRNVSVPPGMYRRSRSGKRKGDNHRPSLVDPPSPISEPGSPRHEHGTYPLYIPFEGQARSSPCPRRLSDSSGSDAHEDDFYPWKRPRERAAYAFPVEDQTDPVAAGLAPLSYLQSLQNPRRNPADEVVLRALASFN
ncbi:Gti1/Pac2 family-domain-containing protein [Gautieria morchelliformis]|nr:Gti1/Pac2 family-domain-containing protein [Gautieria morchelliformis]